MEVDEYITIKKPSQGVFKDRKSRFIALAFPLPNEIEFKKTIKQVKKEYNDATHYCYAYVLGLKREVSHSSDDGEPANSAGVQILGQINSKQLTNILIIVIRYYGGVKLGVPGLINSYRSATINAINNAEIIKEHEKAHYKINFNYLQMSTIMGLLKEYQCQINFQDFDSITIELECYVDFSIRKKFESDFINNVKLTKNITIQII